MEALNEFGLLKSGTRTEDFKRKMFAAKIKVCALMDERDEYDDEEDYEAACEEADKKLSELTAIRDAMDIAEFGEEAVKKSAENFKKLQKAVSSYMLRN